jgi:hypothetical protein
VVLSPDVAPCVDSRFDCRDLLQRSVIHYKAERKASSAIISAPVQGVMTGTVASVARGPSEDRSSGLVSTQAGASILAASVGGLYRGGRPSYSFLIQRAACKTTSVGGVVSPNLRIHQKRKMSAAGIPPNSPIAQAASCI